MKAFNLFTLIVTILAGLEVGLVGIIDVDPVAYAFGAATPVTRTIEVIFGLCALYQIYPFIKAWSVGEVRAEAAQA